MECNGLFLILNSILNQKEARGGDGLTMIWGTAGVRKYPRALRGPFEEAIEETFCEEVPGRDSQTKALEKEKFSLGLT